MSLRRLISRDSFSSTSTTPPPNPSSGYSNSEYSNQATSAPSSAPSYSTQVHSSYSNTPYSGLTPFSNSRNGPGSGSYGSARSNYVYSPAQFRGPGVANGNGPNNGPQPVPPLTNGADKIYGMENFGYTCYCNSVLQCLYYSKAFRESIVAFPQTLNNGNDANCNHDNDNGSDNKINYAANSFDMDDYILQQELAFKNKQARRKVETRGTKPHPFTVDPASYQMQNQNNTSASNNPAATPSSSSASSSISNFNDIRSSNASTPSKMGRRLSIFSKNKDTQDDISMNGNGNIINSNNNNYGTSPSSSALSTSGSALGLNHVIASSAPSSTSHLLQFPSALNNHLVVNKAFDASSYSLVSGKPDYEGLRGIPIGDYVPGANIPVVGFTDDASATVESKKRAALLKGPILNVDHTLKAENGSNNAGEIREGLFTAIKDLFECMVENQSRVGVVSPANLMNILKRENELFRAAMHQDAHEFLNFLLNEIIESVDGYKPKNKVSNQDNVHWIHNLFEGLLSNETKCLTCESVSRRDEKFLDLSLDISANKSITQCLRQFSASEMLCGRNKFHCDNCGGLQEAEKRMRIKRLPKILALHLKRFKFTEDMQQNTKLFHRVVYPEYLRLMETTYDAVNPEKLYQLYAIVVHIGGGPYHGHYVSIVKTETSGWLLFDDEMVESVDPTYVFNFFGEQGALASAYVLFYQEIDPDQLASDNVYTVTPDELSSGSLDVKDQQTTTTPQQPADETDLSISTPSPFVSQHSSGSTSFASVNVIPTPPPSQSSLAMALKNARTADASANDVETTTPTSAFTTSSIPATPVKTSVVPSSSSANTTTTATTMTATTTTTKTSNSTASASLPLTHIQEDDGELESHRRPESVIVNPFEDSLSPVSSIGITPMAIPIPSKGNSVVSLVDLNRNISDNNNESPDSAMDPKSSVISPIKQTMSNSSIPSVKAPVQTSLNNPFNSHSMDNYQARQNSNIQPSPKQQTQKGHFADTSLQSINGPSSSYSSSSVGSFGGTSVDSNSTFGTSGHQNKARRQSWWKKSKDDIPTDGNNTSFGSMSSSGGGASIGAGRNASIGSFASSVDSSKEKRRFFGFGKKS